MNKVKKIPERTYKRVNLGKYIVADPYICHGKPTFKGTRKMVHCLIEVLASGMTTEELIEQSELPGGAIVEVIELAAKAVKKYYSVPYPEPKPIEEIIKKEAASSGGVTAGDKG
jgi:uncharacterized protein (DUF433 family)